MDNPFLKKLNFDFLTHQKILGLIAKIDLYKGKWLALEKIENTYLKELQKIATIASIGSSTRIEGSTMTDSEVKELLQNIKITKLKTRDEEEVLGYYDTLEIIYENCNDINLSENQIKFLHKNLLKYSHKDENHRGNYKKLSNKVVTQYPKGVQKVIFNTTEVHLVEKEMQELIQFSSENFEKKEIHSLIIIALFVYEFLSIHPFQDGNGRLSRLLTTLLLLQNEYVFIQYLSFENLIEKSKKNYYNALMRAQKNRYSEKEIIKDWMVYFLENLFEITEKLDLKYDVLKAKGGYINERQNQIINFIKQNQPVKISDIDQFFSEYKRPTIKNDLSYLKSEKKIISAGIGKATVYLTPEN